MDSGSVISYSGVLFALHIILQEAQSTTNYLPKNVLSIEHPKGFNHHYSVKLSARPSLDNLAMQLTKPRCVCPMYILSFVLSFQVPPTS